MEIKPDAQLACLGLGAAQLAVTARLLLRFYEDFSRSLAEYSPPVSVLVACKGGAEDLERNAACLLNQEYGGFWELLFVVPSRRDPAYARLKGIVESRSHARLLVSGSIPERCSGKNLDLLYALDRASANTEVFAFADADVRVGSDWLRNMVAPLSDPDIVVTTAPMLYAPERPGFWSLMRMVWVGAGIPYMELMGCVTGQSCAIRKRDFQELEVALLWARALMDDLSLTARLKERRKKVRFVACAMPSSAASCGFGEFLSQFNRWILAFRLYVKPVWLLGLSVTALKAWMLFRGLWPRVDWLLLALLFGLDAANLYAVFWIYRRYLPDRFSGIAPSYRNFRWRAALSAPFLQVAYWVNFLHSLRPPHISWGGITYCVRGPQDVSVAPPKASRVRRI